MKKILCIFAIFEMLLSTCPFACAINVGTFKSESEYGLIDAFEFNWQKRQRQNGKKFIQLKEDASKKRSEKDKEIDLQTEYERTKYMYQGEALI